MWNSKLLGQILLRVSYVSLYVHVPFSVIYSSTYVRHCMTSVGLLDIVQLNDFLSLSDRQAEL
jgi:hypothetical protein